MVLGKKLLEQREIDRTIPKELLFHLPSMHPRTYEEDLDIIHQEIFKEIVRNQQTIALYNIDAPKEITNTPSTHTTTIFHLL